MSRLSERVKRFEEQFKTTEGVQKREEREIEKTTAVKEPWQMTREEVIKLGVKALPKEMVEDYLKIRDLYIRLYAPEVVGAERLKAEELAKLWHAEENFEKKWGFYIPPIAKKYGRSYETRGKRLMDTETLLKKLFEKYLYRGGHDFLIIKAMKEGKPVPNEVIKSMGIGIWKALEVYLLTKYKEGDVFIKKSDLREAFYRGVSPDELRKYILRRVVKDGCIKDWKFYISPEDLMEIEFERDPEWFREEFVSLSRLKESEMIEKWIKKHKPDVLKGIFDITFTLRKEAKDVVYTYDNRDDVYMSPGSVASYLTDEEKKRILEEIKKEEKT